MYDATKTYTSDDTKTPYVEYDKNYYILVADTATGITPGSNPDVWEKMEKFNSLYSEILMADGGSLGSFYFYGDFMFSEDGADNTTYNGQTVSFNPEDTTPGLFHPNYFVNQRTGYMYCQEATIGGTINAKDGTIGGLIIDNTGIHGTSDQMWKVYLREVGSHKLSVVTAVRNALGIGLKEAKNIVDSTPTYIPVNTFDGSTALITALQAAGATVDSPATPYVSSLAFQNDKIIANTIQTVDSFIALTPSNIGIMISGDSIYMSVTTGNEPTWKKVVPNTTIVSGKTVLTLE